LVEPLARKAAIAPDAARWRVAALEPDYLIADQLVRGATSGLQHEVAASWGEGSLGAGLMALAAARAAHHSAARVITKYDAFGAPVRARIDRSGSRPTVADLAVLRTARRPAGRGVARRGGVRRLGARPRPHRDRRLPRHRAGRR